MRKVRARAKLKPNRWQASDEWRAIGSAAIRTWNAKRHRLPRCGARRKRDGEPCQQIAMANGKCFLHGGRTGAGPSWHVPRWPDRDAPDAEAKLRRKLKDQQRAAAKRAKRLAAMSPAERQRYDAWQRSHRPGNPADRERRRQERRQNEQIRAAAAKQRQPPNEEALKLRRQIEAAEAELRALQAALDQRDDLGVFG